jgi:hypothetical protein
MDPRLFAEWAEMDERLRRTISTRVDDQFAESGGGASHEVMPTGPSMSELIFIVSRADAKTYSYLKRTMATAGVAVIMDRRTGERRQARPATVPDRRNCERRQQDVTSELRSYGWALVHR